MSCLFLNPRQGEAPLTWAELPKKEANIRNPGCGPPSRACGNSPHLDHCGRDYPYAAGVMVSFTAATSWLSVKGFGRKANCWFSGRLFSNASSAYPETKLIFRSGL